MIVIVDVSGHGGVVVIPLLLSDHAVAVAVAKRGEELDEHLLVGHLTAHNLRVMRSVVDDTQVGAGNCTIAVGIEFAEALIDDLLTSLIGCTTQAEQEFVVAHDAVFVSIEVVQQDLSLIHRNLRAHVLHTPVELLLVNLAITIVIEDAEGASHSTDGPYTTCVQTCPDAIENFYS